MDIESSQKLIREINKPLNDRNADMLYDEFRRLSQSVIDCYSREQPNALEVAVMEFNREFLDTGSTFGYRYFEDTNHLIFLGGNNYDFEHPLTEDLIFHFANSRDGPITGLAYTRPPLAQVIHDTVVLPKIKEMFRSIEWSM